MALLTEEEVEAFTLAQEELGDDANELEANDFGALAIAQGQRKQDLIMAAAQSEADLKMQEKHKDAVQKAKERRRTIAQARRVSVAFREEGGKDGVVR